MTARSSTCAVLLSAGLALVACRTRPFAPLMPITDDAGATSGFPDFATVADLAVADLGVADLATSDLSMPDFAQPDLRVCVSALIVSTLAGNGRTGIVDGTGGANGTAQFYNPFHVTADGAGNIYVADQGWEGNGLIRSVSPDGTTTTLPPLHDSYEFPTGVAIDDAGIVYIAERGNYRITKVAPDGTRTVLAGHGFGFTDGTGGANGTAQFNLPSAIARDGAGFFYIADTGNNSIRKVAPDGTTTTLAGNGIAGFRDGTGGRDGTTEFHSPIGISVDSAGIVYVADQDNHRIRKIATDGTTTTLAGNGNPGNVDGTGGPDGTAELYNPSDVALDGAGNLYVPDWGNSNIRKVAPDGTTTTLVGGDLGFADGDGCVARFNRPVGTVVVGNRLIVSDAINNRIRQIALPQ